MFVPVKTIWSTIEFSTFSAFTSGFDWPTFLPQANLTTSTDYTCTLVHVVSPKREIKMQLRTAINDTSITRFKLIF